jgi:hypothetical protein
MEQNCPERSRYNSSMKKGDIYGDGFPMRHCQTLIPQSLHRKAVATIDPTTRGGAIERRAVGRPGDLEATHIRAAVQELSFRL